MRRMLAGLLAIPLLIQSGCAGTLSTEAEVCTTIFQPLGYSGTLDSPETITGIVEHNAKWCSLRGDVPECRPRNSD